MESKTILPISSFLDQKQKTLIYDISGSVVEFCPFERFSSLLAVGNEQGIRLLKRTFFEIDELGDVSKLLFKGRWGFQQISYVQLGAKVTSIAFSPTTYIDALDSEKFLVTLAIACEENTARFLELSSESKDSKMIILGGALGHQDFINDIDITYLNIMNKTDENVFTGSIVATGGDDCAVIIWKMTYDSPQISAYSTGSPVISVKFHKFHPRRLLVGEYNGTIKILDWAEAGGKWLISLCAGLSYISVKSNLSACLVDVDWVNNRNDIGRIIAVARDGSWLLWDFNGKNNNINALPIVKRCIGSQMNVKQIIFRPGHSDVFAIFSQGFSASSISYIKLVNIFVSMDSIDIMLPFSEALKSEDSYISWHANEGVIAICRNSCLMISCIMDDESSTNIPNFQ
ncbi:hypothetical protein PORY_002608 [Pneumocystis oryctolagi]|uniref:Uncharacterized protein n=1 Tax=Pneumocystis oryctolagi TaxID=42067 RepID=A0ACB7CAA4_9ASCO|nr:hypothetical protein PORY_002608 [Pneumocystis oryctolagi]